MRVSHKTLISLFLLLGITLALPGPLPAQTRNIEVDFSKIIGTIKPLNGVNDGPIATRGAFDLSSNFAELGIKHIRLHDVPWTYENAVDINYIFPRDTADVNDPRSYDFSLTDYYLKSIRALGSDVTFRLGYSAEWQYHPRIHNVPPKDFAKWAAICSHIVQHYNQGWANGFHYDIKYWEIWNETDIPDFWTGTLDQYNQLYELTARGIKKIDPSLKVGGPTLAVHYEFLDGFLKYCQSHNVPVDFVPWHIYAPRPYDMVVRAAKIQELMDKYGFSKAESILDEWNYFPGNWHSQAVDAKYRLDLFGKQMGGVPGAAFDASVLIYLQDSTVAIADFYQGTSMFWGGLFDEYGVPVKPYYTFKAFRILLGAPQRVATSISDHSGFAVLAGLSRQKSEAAILISNFGTQDHHYSLSLRNLPWKSASAYEQYAIDGHHNLDLIKSAILNPGTALSADGETPSVCLIRLKAAQ
jgi:hypothetical protein